MELLIVLAVIGGLNLLGILLYAIIHFSTYIVASIKAFPTKTKALYESFVEYNKSIIDRANKRKEERKNLKELKKQEKERQEQEKKEQELDKQVEELLNVDIEEGTKEDEQETQEEIKGEVNKEESSEITNLTLNI